MTTHQTEAWQEAVAEIWQLFRETDARFKDTEVRFKETDARLDARIKETDARLDARFQETEAQFKATDRKINQLSGLFTNQWGRMVEALVEPSALRMFQDRGIEVRYTYRRAAAAVNGRQMELDLLLENGDEVVVVEVKSVLTVSDVDYFLETMQEFFTFFPRYRHYRVYGGVAGLIIAEGVDKYAYRKGLFVLSATGDGLAQIKNDAAFQPRNFAREQAEGTAVPHS